MLNSLTVLKQMVIWPRFCFKKQLHVRRMLFLLNLLNDYIIDRLSTDREEIDKEPQRVNLKNVTKGIYSLNKKPIGIPDKHVIGIDPGKM